MPDPQTNAWGDPIASSTPATNAWGDPIANAGSGDTETHRIRDFFGNLGKSLNPMPALNAAEDRQNQETAQFHQQLNDKQYTEALKTFVRSVPGADTIRAEGQNTIDSLKKAYQDYTRDQQSGGQTGAAFKDAVSAIPFIGRPTVAAGEQWDRGDRAGALGSALPIVAPAVAGPVVDLAKATAAGLPRAATTAAGGLKGAMKAATTTTPVTDLPWKMGAPLKAIGIDNLSTPLAGAAAGSLAGHLVPYYGQPASLVGGVLGGTYPILKGAVEGAGEAWRNSAPQMASSAPLWEKAGIQATPTEAPPDVNPIQALQTPSGRKPGGIQNQVADDVKPAEAPAPVGPSPQLLDAIKKAVGPKGNIQAVVDDMISRGEKDPYTGAPLGVAPQPVSAPTAPTPAPVANPIAALKTPEPAQASVTPSPDFVPPTSTVVEHTWIAPDGTKQPVKLMSEEGLGKYATDNGLDPDEAEAYLKQNGYAIDDRKQLMKSLMFHAEDLGYDRQAVYDMFRKDFGIRKVDNANSEQILKTYQKMLDTPGPMTSQATGHVDFRKGNAAPQPVNLPPKAFSALPQVPGTNGLSLEDQLRQSLPPKP